MGRAPCCGRMGLKKGPWSQEEDMILVSYIQTYGHGNWRALPKHAGLLRCGKSCRLRWTNYLRPDVKRGDFTKEEEETIIYLHASLGNGWSAIAAKLPGRTDNEIKNIWHTCLKKRFNPNQSIKNSKRRRRCNTKSKKEEANKNELGQEEHVSVLACSQCHDASYNMKEGCMDSLEELPEIEDILWPGEAPPAYKSCARDEEVGSTCKKPDRAASNGDVISFWMNLLLEAGNLD